MEQGVASPSCPRHLGSLFHDKAEYSGFYLVQTVHLAGIGFGLRVLSFGQPG